MDIPVPTDALTEPEKTKIAVASSSVAKPAEPIAVTKSFTTSEPALNQEDEERKKIAELIASKKYFLGIKEKRSSQLFALGVSSKKSKKSKKKTTKKSEKKPSSKRKKLVQVSIFVLLIIGLLVAVDAQLINIGFDLPFDLIKS